MQKNRRSEKKKKEEKVKIVNKKLHFCIETVIVGIFIMRNFVF